MLHGEIMDDALVDQEMQARLREVETLHKEVLNLEVLSEANEYSLLYCYLPSIYVPESQYF